MIKNDDPVSAGSFFCCILHSYGGEIFFENNAEEYSRDKFRISLCVSGEYQLSVEELRIRFGRRRKYVVDQLFDGCHYRGNE